MKLNAKISITKIPTIHRKKRETETQLKDFRLPEKEETTTDPKNSIIRFLIFFFL